MIGFRYLQSYVSPICGFTNRPSLNRIEKLYGTGFLISSSGLFLTARHVLENAYADSKSYGGKLGIFPTQIVDGGAVSLTIPIDDYEAAPEPFDIAVFSTTYKSTTPLRLQNYDVQVWQDVGAMGYPASAVNVTSEEFQLQQRAHKGYVQRVIPAGRLHPGPRPACFELNFTITNGLSGSPLFIHKGDYDILIGVCVGSHQSHVVQYEEYSREHGDETFREKIERIEEFGIAHDLRPLINWKPKCLGGKSLGEASAEAEN